MTRKFTGTKLVIASHNSGKVREMTELLIPFKVNVIEAEELDLTEPEETGKTFVANAILKAKFSAVHAGLPSFADDSGLVVEVLNGAPGIYSARWAGPSKNFNLAIKSVEKAIKETGLIPETIRAYFVSALCIYWPDGHFETFEGKVHGSLTFPPRGINGFGYDPIFVPIGHKQTFGEMSEYEKNELSHRTLAFEKLKSACF